MTTAELAATEAGTGYLDAASKKASSRAVGSNRSLGGEASRRLTGRVGRVLFPGKVAFFDQALGGESVAR